MATLRESIQTNKKIMIIIATLLGVLIIFVGKFYMVQTRENQALKLKLLSMTANKRTPKPWSSLTNKTKLQTPETLAAALAPKGAPTTSTPTVTAVPLAEQDTEELANKLDSQMKDVQTVKLETLDENIDLANEIISREPDSYAAYKAKLISMLVKEGKYDSMTDDNEVESILEHMAQFNTGNEAIPRKEAVLIGNTNREVSGYENQLAGLEQRRGQIEEERLAFEPNSDDYKVLTQNLNELDVQQNTLYQNMEIAQGSLDQSLAMNDLNEDVVEIPLMRLMAKNDYASVVENSNTLIARFPDSPNAYYYLVKALEMQGEKDRSLSVLQNSQLPGDAQAMILDRLESEKASDPKNYWEKLNF